MQYKIEHQENVKLGHHDGQFTKSYYIERAVYDFKIRSFTVIEYKDKNIFGVINSDKHEEFVYLTRSIQNCSCDWFSENQCGTCPHIEAVSSLGLRNLNERNITYINEDKVYKQGDGSFVTPAVKTFEKIQDIRKVKFSDIKVKDFSIFDGITFFDYQKFSIQKMLEARRSILCLDMGLGKTLCALACCHVLKDHDIRKTIIVCPNNLKYQWAAEIEKFNIGTSCVINKGTDLLLYIKQDFLIISYEMLNRNQYVLENHNFDIAIVDEIQKAKNGESVTWKTLSKLKTNFLFTLSGTPVQNSVSDLTSIISLINKYELQPEWKFYQDYCITSRAKILGLNKHKIPDLLKKLARYFINPVIDYSLFKKATKVEETINTKLTDEQIPIHDNYIDQAKPLLAKAMNYPLTFAEKAKLNAMLLKARQASIDIRLLEPTSTDKSERFQKIEELISQKIMNNEKVVVFSEWIKSLDLLKDYLDQNKIKYVEFNSKITAKKKAKNLFEFINGKAMVFLSTDSGGVGVDGLQFASYNMIHVESTWNPKKIAQRNGRLVRTLQKKDKVNIYYFYSDCEIEEMLKTANERKNTLFKEILG